MSKAWNVAKDMWILGLRKSFLRWRTLALICLFTVATVLALHSSVPAQVESSTQSDTKTTEDDRPADSRDTKKDQEVVRPLDESTKPRIEFIGNETDDVVHDKRIILRGRVDGPDALTVRVDGEEADVSGNVFAKEVELADGVNRIPVKATSLDGTSSVKTLEITQKPDPKIEFPPEPEPKNVKTHFLSAQYIGFLIGATITVNSTEDELDDTPGDGKCETASGNGTCTLRAAVQETNALPGKDTIELSDKRYVFTRTGRYENGAETGDLDVTDPAGLSIRGSGRDLTIIDANKLDRIIQTFPIEDSGLTELDLTGLTITGGDVDKSSKQNLDGSVTYYYGDGGGIFTGDTNLTLVDVTVQNNVASWAGGGISNYGDGSLSISRSQIAGNKAYEGGGIINNVLGGDNARFELTDSKVNDNAASRLAGGVANLGTNNPDSPLTVTRSNISGNVSGERGAGGGIYNEDASLTIIGSTINNNITSGWYGGGISNFHAFNSDTFRIIDSVISGNRCDGPCDGGGGGISYFDSNKSDVFEVHDSTIEKNVVDGEDGGGGIVYWGGSEDSVEIVGTNITGNSVTGGPGGALSLQRVNVDIKNSTISQNETRWGTGNNSSGWGGTGGGIYMSHTQTNTSNIVNSTISGNHAFGDPNEPTPTGEPLGGGGLYTDGTLSITNTTITGNTAPTGSNVFNHGSLESKNALLINGIEGAGCEGDAYSVFTSKGHNIDSGNSCGFDGNTDLSNTDPLLEPLSDNGGSTKTHAIPESSLAVDAGGQICPDTDQRGVARMQDGNNDGSFACDIGAFELKGNSDPVPPSDPPGPVVPPNINANLFSPGALDVDWRNALTSNPFEVAVNVQNAGEGAATNVSANLWSPAEGVMVRGEATRVLGTIKPGQSVDLSFDVEVPEPAVGQMYTLQLDVTADGVESVSGFETINVPTSGHSFVSIGDSTTTGYSVETCNETDDTADYRFKHGCRPPSEGGVEPPATPYPELVADRLAAELDPAYEDLNRVGVWGYEAEEAVQEYQKANERGDAYRRDIDDEEDEPNFPVTDHESQLHGIKGARDLIVSSLGVNDMEFGNWEYWYEAYAQGTLKEDANERLKKRAAEPINTLFDEHLIPADRRGVDVFVTEYPNTVSSTNQDWGCVANHKIGEEIVTTVNGYISDNTDGTGIKTISFYDLWNSDGVDHGAGTETGEPWVFGNDCDFDSILYGLTPFPTPDFMSPGDGPETNLANEEGVQLIMDPHPNSAGTKAMADEVVARIKESQ